MIKELLDRTHRKSGLLNERLKILEQQRLQFDPLKDTFEKDLHLVTSINLYLTKLQKNSLDIFYKSINYISQTHRNKSGENK